MTLLALLLLAAAAPAGSEGAALSRITAAEISGHLRFLSDDLLEGRRPGQPGDELATKYLAAQMEAFGLKPLGDNGTWFQAVPLIELRADVPRDVHFTAGGKDLTLHALGGNAADLIFEANAHIDRATLKDVPLVFAGYGITAPEYGWDDYKDADVKGKVVVVMNFNPPFKGQGVRLWYGRWDYKYINASRHGAVGALVIHTTPSAGYPWQVLANRADGSHQDLPPSDAEPRTMQFQGWITEAAAVRLAQQGQQDLDALRKAAGSRDFRVQPLGSTLSLDMAITRNQIRSANVVGILPGTDPRLSQEAVIYTAHHDHLGKGTPPPGTTDGIYNGALDNASGCATLLAIAHAATFAPPKRSVIFAFVTAEEQGLLGSRWLAEHPPIPAERIAADINLDVVNPWGRTTDVGVLGLGKSSADGVVRKVAASQGRTVHGDPFPDRGLFYRSDMFSLARVGVPPVSVKGGPSYVGRPQGWGAEQNVEYEHKRYHQPSDEYHGDWDLSGDVQDAQLQLAVGLGIANAPQMPKWTPGDEFEKARTQPRGEAAGGNR